jgi:hypothetical protein
LAINCLAVDAKLTDHTHPRQKWFVAKDEESVDEFNVLFNVRKVEPVKYFKVPGVVFPIGAIYKHLQAL